MPVTAGAVPEKAAVPPWPAGRSQAVHAPSRPRTQGYGAPSVPSPSTVDLFATRILTQPGVPEFERLAGAAVAPVFGQQLCRPATGAPAEDLADTLLVRTQFTRTGT